MLKSELLWKSTKMRGPNAGAPGWYITPCCLHMEGEEHCSTLPCMTRAPCNHSWWAALRELRAVWGRSRREGKGEEKAHFSLTQWAAEKPNVHRAMAQGPDALPLSWVRTPCLCSLAPEPESYTSVPLQLAHIVHTSRAGGAAALQTSFRGKPCFSCPEVSPCRAQSQGPPA